jgi:hypothetical protein
MSGQWKRRSTCALIVISIMGLARQSSPSDECQNCETIHLQKGMSFQFNNEFFRKTRGFFLLMLYLTQ